MQKRLGLKAEQQPDHRFDDLFSLICREDWLMLAHDHVAPKERKLNNIFFYNVGTSSAKDKIAFEHPAIFPEQLALDQISTWTNEGDVVYDCFMGSGTTAKAAETLGRRWIGSEISKDYVALAKKRLQPYISGTEVAAK